MREDGEDKKGRKMEAEMETEKEMVKKRTREEEKEENKTVSVKRKCVGFLSAESFDIFSHGEDLESCGGVSCGDLLENPDYFSDCEPETRTDASAVPVVTDVLVFPILLW